MRTNDDAENTSDRQDPAAQRLRKLGSRSVDLTNLKDRVRKAIAENSSGETKVSVRRRRWMSPLVAVAAGLLIVGAVAVVFLLAEKRPAFASVAELLNIHQDNASGVSEATPVNSIEAARRVLTAQWDECPILPTTDVATTISCHVHQFGNKRLACLAMKIDGHDLTLAVAHAQDMRLPASGTVVRNGITYFVESSAKVNIVIEQRDGLWLCLMGELPIDQLVQVVASLRV